MKTREPDNESERIIEEKVNKKFQELIRKTNQIESITDEMVKKAIAKLKYKRASDRLGWRAEWLKEGGGEIVKSLSKMYKLGYDPNTLKILYEMNKETDIIIRAPVGNTNNIQIKEVVKQGTIFGHIMLCRDIQS